MSEKSCKSHPRANILGVGINVISITDLLECTQVWIENQTYAYICVVPAHSIMACTQDPALRLIFNQSGLATPDGMSLVWLIKISGYKNIQRVYGPDLLINLCGYGLQRDYRHFFYGGSVDVLDNLHRNLIKQFPDLKIADFYAPLFRALTLEEDQEVIERINRSQADILWVGLGSPKQERWMSEHLGKIEGPIVLFIGQQYLYKGYVQMLDATKLVWDRVPDAHFVFIGPPVGNSSSVFSKYSDPRIHFLGKTDLQEKTDALDGVYITVCSLDAGELWRRLHRSVELR